MINGSTKLIGLLGSPVAHSFSPMLHNYALKASGINAKYLAFDVNQENLEAAIRGLSALNFIGANVTIPHKIEIMQYLDEIDEKALKIGAVNTIVNVNNKLIGYNTDVDGFLMSFESRNIQLKDKTIAIFGAGGAAKGVIVGLLSEHVKGIDVFSRNKDKVSTFVNHFKLGRVTANTYGSFDSSKAYDVIINTTPIGTYPNVDESILNTSCIGGPNTIFYDLIYNPKETKFLRDARQSGRSTINGLDMLIFQGLKSFQYWLPEVAIKNTVTLDSIIKLFNENNIL